MKNLKNIMVILGFTGYILIQFEIEQVWILLLLIILIFAILMVMVFRTFQNINHQFRNRTIKKNSIKYLKKIPILIFLLLPSDLIKKEMEKISEVEILLVLVIFVLWMILKKRGNVYKKI